MVAKVGDLIRRTAVTDCRTEIREIYEICTDKRAPQLRYKDDENSDRRRGGGGGVDTKMSGEKKIAMA